MSTSSLSTVLLPPAVFLGLGITLWTYKCVMMVLFQNQIIYMPRIPPFSRSAKVQEYEQLCRPVVWTRNDIIAKDGVRISLLVSSWENQGKEDLAGSPEKRSRIVVLYFQG